MNYGLNCLNLGAGGWHHHGLSLRLCPIPADEGSGGGGEGRRSQAGEGAGKARCGVPQRGNKAQQAARRQLTICERDIARAEERIAALEADMEAAACDYEKLNELVGQKDAAQAELDALYERWEQLSEEAEG